MYQKRFCSMHPRPIFFPFFKQNKTKQKPSGQISKVTAYLRCSCAAQGHKQFVNGFFQHEVSQKANME